MTLSTKLDQASNDARAIERKLEQLTMCARWLVRAIDAAESVHDSELQRQTEQVREVLRS